ncbi:ABC transporter permease [Meiothermus ruber]|jgi:peptide/nickel transport system permease protein|uniref:Binding-protein-dependent transport systems inner membrane component n=2 Tax=Meiothermus ruber (strain ATCC 35948 / DSM 1279 / VKM B-1258 / 21) TaxID=504728 RepID=A0A806CZI7_MEIRD|nr:ABC transporter permease [Meiothermus ruber]ADD29028.1 binding-protein-dependent transport systems inner membrane component [Meiothermus ruber DSM 1279]MCL6528640.1 ABC transporter permease [Meiothermus ruber]GAO75947.1 binding-protein-dependent transport system inner membrane protein [Meiothermus ruber H328]
MAAVATTSKSKSQSTWALAWRRFRKHKAAMFSLGVVIALVLMAIFAPWIAPYSPTAQPTGDNLADYYFQGPSWEHWLGTDELGRDVLSRIIYGARISLLVGFVAAIAAALLGTTLGVIAGYFSGRPLRFYIGPLAKVAGGWKPWPFALWRVASWLLLYTLLFLAADLAWTLSGANVQALFSGTVTLNNLLSLLGLALIWGAILFVGVWGLFGQGKLDLDVVISRFMDFMLTIPELPLLLVLSALLRDNQGVVGQWAQAVFGESASVFIIITIIVLFGWIGTGRLIRGAVLSLREQDFTTAAQALGAGEARIMFRHLVPNTLAPLIVNATLAIGGAILTEAALSFLGFGIQPPVATWGNMLTKAQEYIFTAPWLALAPGFMIFLTVLAFNYLGDGLRDALDPRSRL